MLEPGFEILYEKKRCLVVSKPPGLLTQAPPGIDSLELRIKSFLKERDQKPGKIYLGVPHRLDRPASGVMVFGRDVRTTRRLARQFENRLVKKTYWACVEGHVDPAAGTWEDFVRKMPERARAEVVEPEHPDAREALLHYRTLAVSEWGSWLEIELATGRTHQVRVQAGSRGHPVLGDAQYGAITIFGPQPEDTRLKAIALHARCLTFHHPTTKETVEVTAPVWKDWLALGLTIDDSRSK